MNKYRIKKETHGDTTKYYPQEKFLWWWYNLFAFDVYFDGNFACEICSLNRAKIIKSIFSFYYLKRNNLYKRQAR